MRPPSADQLLTHARAVDPERLREHLIRLSVVRNQLLNPLAIRRVMDYIIGTCGRAGLDTRTEPFYWWLSGWRRHHNLIATLPARAPSAGGAAGRIIIGAHYDTVPFCPGFLRDLGTLGQ